VQLPRIALDIDTPDDLALFLATPSRTRARALLGNGASTSALAARLSHEPSSCIARPGPRRRRARRRRGDGMADCADLAALMEAAAALRDRGHGANVSYSRKVFIPLTKLCRDSCHYCTFAHPPRRNETAI
jgi:hypothetical protein